MTKAGRSTALATLLVACALLSAGFVYASHGHDDDHPGGDGHQCVVCCLQHHASATTTTTAAPTAPDLATLAAAANSRRSGCDAARATQATRGPPA